MPFTMIRVQEEDWRRGEIWVNPEFVASVVDREVAAGSEVSCLVTMSDGAHHTVRGKTASQVISLIHHAMHEPR